MIYFDIAAEFAKSPLIQVLAFVAVCLIATSIWSRTTR